MGWAKSGRNNVNVNDVLIFDIETYSPYDISNFSRYVATANLKWFGAYSYKHKQFYYYTHEERDKIQKLIDEHRVIAGFNSKSFDIPIMINNAYNLDYKIRIDLLRVLWDPDNRVPVRSNIMKVGGKILKDFIPDYKLKTIGETLGLSVPKGDLDYTIFEKTRWDDNEINKILEYLHADIVLTKELFEYLYKEFEPLKDFMSELDQKKYNWMRTSTGSYTYKVVCHETGLEEKYPEGFVEHEKYEGGFVALPTQDEARGKLYALDFTSAYPHAFMMGNLYSNNCNCCEDEEKWSGNKLFPVNGKYCQKQMGKIETTIKNLFLQRLEYKENKDPREYAVKIIINTLYGISGSPTFMSLYNTITASDCTLIARQMIKHARKLFDEAGYNLLYTDTDSVYLEDVYNDKDKLLKVRDQIVEDIKDGLPFPQDTFGMSIDEEMKAMWFFKGKLGEYSKKFYAYLTNDNKLKLKGVPLIKSTCSKVSQEVYNILKPLMIEREDIKFDREFIKEKVFEVLREDMSLAAKLYKTKSLSSYSSPTCLQAQISSELGIGNHWLIPNYKIGVGKGMKRYATLEQAKDLEVEDLFLDTIFDTELSIFIKDWQHPSYVKKMHRLEKERRKPKSRSLNEFIEEK